MTLESVFRIADPGLANAQSLLSFVYQHVWSQDDDDFVLQDYAEALQWSLRAATQGGANAQLEAGWLYRDVLEDFVHAHMWFNLAAAQGHVIAMNEREQVQRQMTPQQIAQAQALATRCFESNYSDCD